MLDIKVIRQDPERVKAAMKSRNKDMDKEIDEILEIDVERRAINAAVDNMKAEQNRVSKLIPQYKKEGKDVAPILAEMKELSGRRQAGRAGGKAGYHHPCHPQYPS